MKRRKEVGRLDIENPKPKWSKTIYLKDGKLMKTIHDGNFSPTPPSPPMPETGPVFFEATQANSTVSMVSTLETAPNLEYSTDGLTWQEWQHTTEDGTHTFDTITLGAVGDRVYFRGNNPNGLCFYSESAEMPNLSNFVLTGAINGGGNIMSLLDADMELTEVPQFGFLGLFGNLGYGFEPALLTPPAMNTITIIGEYGCGSMFAGCTSLTSAADMPLLTDIGEQGLAEIYAGCTSLTSAADMPLLMDIGEQGCNYMYNVCTFNMSDDGTTLNFAFPTPPVKAGETTYSTAYEIAEWMGNTNGFDDTPKGL